MERLWEELKKRSLIRLVQVRVDRAVGDAPTVPMGSVRAATDCM